MDDDHKKYILSFDEVANLSREEAISIVGSKAWDIATLHKIVNDMISKGKPPPHTNDPTLFISYRWSDLEHISWVTHFVKDLKRRGYNIMFDKYAQKESKPPSVPELIARLTKCNIFVPILTEQYRRRIEEEGKKGIEDGWVFDEWYIASHLQQQGYLKFLGIWRSGTRLSHPFTAESVCDFRIDSSYEYALSKYFPTTKVWIIGVRENKTGRMIGPIYRKNEAETLTRMEEEEEFVEIHILDYIIEDTKV
jgi:TIR domain